MKLNLPRGFAGYRNTNLFIKISICFLKQPYDFEERTLDMVGVFPCLRLATFFVGKMVKVRLKIFPELTLLCPIAIQRMGTSNTNLLEEGN